LNAWAIQRYRKNNEEEKKGEVDPPRRKVQRYPKGKNPSVEKKKGSAGQRRHNYRGGES